MEIPLQCFRHYRDYYTKKKYLIPPQNMELHGYSLLHIIQIVNIFHFKRIKTYCVAYVHFVLYRDVCSIRLRRNTPF